MIDIKQFWLGHFFNDFGTNNDFEIILSTRDYTIKYCKEREVERIVDLRSYICELINSDLGDDEILNKINPYRSLNYIIESKYRNLTEWLFDISEIMNDYIKAYPTA